MRVVVVGSGIAGLVTAIRASRNHDVVLVTKDAAEESNTRYAQGGIAAALFPDDSVAAHVEDTLAAGAGLADPAAVEALCGDGPRRVRDLIELGVRFDRASGEPEAPLARGREAAHSRPRILHAGGDETGRAVVTALLGEIRRRPIEVRAHTFLRDLVVAPEGVRRVTGIDAIGPDGRALRIAADAVVLASGGTGQLFRHTTNPLVATGDGVAAAFRAGAAVQDLEFTQFHPTALAVPGTPLVSEAVRGEGAVLRDETGARFMTAVHPDAELAPRDVVARGIAAAMGRQAGRPVLLDATALGARRLTERFPGITRVLARHGLDWTREPVPVTPAAHYAMGGVRTDTAGRSTLTGLLAVGEVACTGAHGANRLASNSLLEALVFAWRAADALDGPPAPAALPEAETIAFSPPVGEGRPVERADLQELMWNAAGLFRDAGALRSAAARLAGWEARGDGIRAQEDRNLLELGRLTVAAALRREETRGAHARRDFPRPSHGTPRSLVWAARVPAGAPLAAVVA